MNRLKKKKVPPNYVLLAPNFFWTDKVDFAPKWIKVTYNVILAFFLKEFPL